MKKIVLLDAIAKYFGFKDWREYVVFAHERSLSVVPFDIERAVDFILNNFFVKKKTKKKAVGK